MNIHSSELSLMIHRLEEALDELRQVHSNGGHVELPGKLFDEARVKPQVSRVTILFPVSWERYMVDGEIVYK